MVRLKQRYLLLNILYPDRSTKSSATSTVATTTTATYLNFHAPTPRHLGPQNFLNIVRAQIVHLFGDHGLGVSASSLKIVYFSQATSTAILRVPRAYYRLAWAALTFIHELPPPHGNGSLQGTKCVVRVVRVSGTIRKAEEELVRRSRQEIVRAKLAQGENTTALLDRIAGGGSGATAAATHIATPLQLDDVESSEEDLEDTSDDE